MKFRGEAWRKGSERVKGGAGAKKRRPTENNDDDDESEVVWSLKVSRREWSRSEVVCCESDS